MREMKKKIQDYLGNDNSNKIFLSELKLLLDNKVSPEWYSLEQEEIFLRLGEEGLDSSGEYDIAKNKINALKTFLLSDSFYYDIDIFQKIILAMNEEIVIPDVFQDISLSDIVYSLSELHLIYDFDPSFFSNDIRAYIASIAKEDGFILLPRLIGCCQENLDRLNNLPDISNWKELISKRMRDSVDSLDKDNVIDQQVLKLRRLSLSVMVEKPKDEVIDGNE